MKILHLAGVRFNKAKNHIQAGGISHSVPKLAEAQTLNNNKVGIISTRESDNPLENDIYWKSISKYSFIKLMFNDPFIRIKKEFGLPDVMHTHDIYEIKSLAFIFHAIKNNIKVFVSPRGNFSSVALSRGKFKKLIYINFFFNLFTAKIEGFAALNDGEKIIIRERYKNKKIIIIGNGTDDNDHYIQRFHHNYNEKLENKKINIGYIGRYEVHIKGLDLLMKAYINYQNNIDNINIKITLIGDHSDKTNSREYFKSMRKNLKDETMFELKGPLFNDDKFEELSKFDVFIHPSRTEGMPNAVLEAMTMGIPCIVTPNTNMGDIINKANCGWVVEKTVEALEASLLELDNIEKNDLYQLGMNGMEFAKRNLNWKTVAASPYTNDE